MNDLRQSLNFLKEVRNFYKIRRYTPKPDGTFESDVEHTWSVAIAAIVLTPLIEEELDIKLDQAKLLKLALIHDLGELDAGDTKTWDESARVGKEERERNTIHRLMKMLPEQLGPDLLGLWEEVEAKIIKSIDRLDPVLHRVGTGVGWADVEVENGTVQALDHRQQDRHSFSKTMVKLYQLLRDEGVEKEMFRT